ncbi:Zinc finger RING/FYVE/PHD-type protein [Dioscorea alata]|uniref:Zinc finger RING/FYVE/PHD-type protein n=1 Tax=Dioscorea alata TaxID=55571 RepID=A0ACB7VSQ2_DIOAL|nr:Zinc finger RING/FYVE/PHD-type protein [Dioscorea alata]
MEITTLLFHLVISILIIHGVSLFMLLNKAIISVVTPLLPVQTRERLAWWHDTLFHSHKPGLLDPCSGGQLRISKFKSGSEDEEEAECVVCLCGIKEGEEIRELVCRHLFHRACLDRWLELWHSRCPLCRSCLIPCETKKKKVSGLESLEMEDLVAFVHDS